IDTASGYDAAFHIEVSNVGGAHWVVTDGSETDDLTGVEKVTINGQTYVLADKFGANVGGFQTVQDAVDAANAGDIVLLAGQTFGEFVNVNKDVTIEGMNHGIPGNGVRGAESVLAGGVKISVDGVTIDGVKIAGTYASHTVDGTDVDNGVLITSSHVTIEN